MYREGDAMTKTIIAFSALVCITLSGCGDAVSVGIIGGADGPTEVIVAEKEDEKMIKYKQITPDMAKEIMDSGEEYTLLDVREQDEYDAGHIPGAILIPYTEIGDKAQDILTDKSALILVYCRSGRRSEIAAEALSQLGYTNVNEFGGILDWKYEVE